MFYIVDSEGDGLLEEITKFHCWVFKIYKEDKFYVFCNYEELSKLQLNSFKSQGCEFFPLQNYIKILTSNKTKGIIAHNLIGFDLPAANKLNGLEYSYKSINNRDLFIADTLIMSRTLHPDRHLPKECPTSIKNITTGKSDKIGPHSLEAWSYRTGTHKPRVFDWSTQSLNIYVDRCIEDTKINEPTYDVLLGEINNIAISNGDRKGDWKLPIRMAHKNFYLIYDQQMNGSLFNERYGWELLDDLDKEMKEMEDELNPLFGEKEMCESKQPDFPSVCFKKPFDYNSMFKKTGGLKKAVTDYLDILGIEDQEDYINSMFIKEEIDGIETTINKVQELLPKHYSLLTTHALNYCKKFGIESEQEAFDEINRVLDGGNPKKFIEKVGLSDVQGVKEFLVRDGWKPSLWNFRNILTNPKTKQKLSKEETEKKLDDYINEFKNHVYWPFILVELGYSDKSKVDPNSDSFRRKCLKNGRNLLSSPMYKDQNGVRCPNLKELTGDTSKKIIRFLSLKHRRSMLKSTDPKKKDTHGLLNNPRLKVDGRISAGVAGVTSTNRKRHFGIVNIPKPKKFVVYGIQMRKLFIAPEHWWNIGADAASVEAFIASHYTIPFDGGEYSKNVITGKLHDNNAIAYSKVSGREINRDNGKNITYALLYGASAKKIARMLSVDINIAKEVVDAFWETNIGLKGVRDAVVEYWNKTNKKYIMGLDGRKLFSRSQHSLVNLLFQSAGSILLDFVLCYWYDRCKCENLSVQRWGEFHDELQFYQKKNEVDIYTFPSTAEVELPKDDDGNPQRDKDPLKPKQIINNKLYSVPKYVDGEWIQCYSRAGEIVDEGFKVASKYYNTNVVFGAEYMYGKDWSECH